jgi:hypothetical protein
MFLGESFNHEKHEKAWRGLIARNPHGRETDGKRTGHGLYTDGKRTAGRSDWSDRYNTLRRRCLTMLNPWL